MKHHSIFNFSYCTKEIVLSNPSPFVLNVLIVEDEFSFALELRMLVEELGYRCAGIVDNAEQALDLIDNKPPDVILMDIDLKGKMTGVELGEKIKHKKIPILFITSYSDKSTYDRANQLKMIGFLVKPLNDFTLLTAIEACLSDIPRSTQDSHLNILNESLLIKKGKLYHKVNIRDIYNIESDLEYVTIHILDIKFVLRESLKNLMVLLNDKNFFRSHQSHIINLSYLKSIDMNEGYAILENKKQVPLSRRNRKLLEERWRGVIR